jgi:hypothetical protein
LEEKLQDAWEDNNYSFTFYFSKSGGANHATYTNKKLFPKGGSQGKFWITKEVDCYSLEIMFFQDEELVNKMILKIEDLTDTTLRIRSLNNEVINFAKVA